MQTAAIETLDVKIKVLTLARKQVTQSVFRQFPKARWFDALEGKDGFILTEELEYGYKYKRTIE